MGIYLIKFKIKIDDSLDAFGVRGGLAVELLADNKINPGIAFHAWQMDAFLRGQIWAICTYTLLSAVVSYAII